MARAVWKGPFVEESLIKKVEKQKNETNKIWDIKKMKISALGAGRAGRLVGPEN